MDVCNSTLYLDGPGSQVGIIRVDNNASKEFNLADQYCKVSLDDRQQFTIGVQLVTFQGGRPGQCGIKVYPYEDIIVGPAYCFWNTTWLKREITSATHQMDLVFKFDQSNIDVNDSVIIDVLFYSYTPANVKGLCDSDDTDVCELSTRCVRLSILEYAKQYNICQSGSKTPEINVDSTEEKETSYFGVAIFAGTLLFLLAVMIGLQLFHSKSFCKSLRLFFCVEDDEDTTDRNADGRPQFTLDAPPPSYSDLSSIDSFQVSTSTNVDNRVSRGNATEAELRVPRDPGISGNSQNSGPFRDPNMHRNISFGGVSVASTLPPSYSEVIIHEDKYDVHE